MRSTCRQEMGSTRHRLSSLDESRPRPGWVSPPVNDVYVEEGGGDT